MDFASFNNVSGVSGSRLSIALLQGMTDGQIDANELISAIFERGPRPATGYMEAPGAARPVLIAGHFCKVGVRSCSGNSDRHRRFSSIGWPAPYAGRSRREGPQGEGVKS